MANPPAVRAQPRALVRSSKVQSAKGSSLLATGNGRIKRRWWSEPLLKTKALWVSAEWGRILPREEAPTSESLCASFGIVAGDETERSSVRFYEHPTLPHGFFLKTYTHRRRWWQGWLKASKAAREARNLSFLRGLGLRTPRVLVHGASHRLGVRLDFEVIATEAIGQAASLVQYWPTLAADDPRRRQLVVMLAEQVRRMHTANFFHRDLKWRNLLVSSDRTGAPRLWWIDCPNGHHVRKGWRQRRAVLKDLATLAKLAVSECTLREQMTFIRLYARGASALERRRLALRVYAYLVRRWKD